MNLPPNLTPMNLRLSGHLLSLWQRGRRRFAIETAFRYRRWHPQSLFTACMRRAIIQLSNNIPVESAATSACTYLLAQAKSPGMETASGTNTYTLALDFCATIRTLLEYISRTSVLTLTSPKDVVLPNGALWSFLSHADESGALHRFVFTDYLSDDEVYKQMHSWEVIGDIVAAQAPMTLHMFSIGRTHDSRRHAAWCRAYKSPAVANLIRFQKKSGNALQGDWKPIYFADNPANRAEVWVDQMLDDNAAEPLHQHVQVKEPSELHSANVYRDIDYEANQILSAGYGPANPDNISVDPFDLPMCRTQCDSPYLCPHQSVCYSATPSISALLASGLYDTLPVNVTYSQENTK